MTDHLHASRRRIHDREAVIGIVGLGYVGLPLVVRFAEEGFRVLGFDNDASKVAGLNRGESPIEHLDTAAIRAAIDVGFEATADMTRAGEPDALLICVPTPLDAHRQPDLSFVLDTAERIAPHLRAGQLVSLESTTYPDTTEDELCPRLARDDLRIGHELFVTYSPEREDPANPNFSTRTIPKICGGVTDACRQLALDLYGAVIDRVVPVSSPAAAEMTKLLENIHRAVNIGLVNEMKIVADRIGIDIYEVIDAAATKPFGFVPYYPGPGLGGHCIPIDPFYLTWKAREYGLNTRFIELAGEVNSAMPAWVLGKTADALNDHGRAIRGSRILVLGVAYKKNVDDMRESPALELMEMLRAKGADIAYSDPHVPQMPRLRRYSFDLASTPIEPGTLAEFDAVLIVTDHDTFDYELLAEEASLIIDARGRYRDRKAQHIVRA